LLSTRFLFFCFFFCFGRAPYRFLFWLLFFSPVVCVTFIVDAIQLRKELLISDQNKGQGHGELSMAGQAHH
jgi:hypothetical protein